jgi:hypothetical protein
MQGVAQLADAASQRRGLLRQRQGAGRAPPAPAAAVVAAEHHPLHLKVVEGILQDAHDVVVGGIEHVGDIAVDKELAGLAAGEHLGGRGCRSSRSTASGAAARRSIFRNSPDHADTSAAPSCGCGPAKVLTSSQVFS